MFILLFVPGSLNQSCFGPRFAISHAPVRCPNHGKLGTLCQGNLGHFADLTCKRNGEGEIRTHASVATRPVFETDQTPVNAGDSAVLGLPKSKAVQQGTHPTGIGSGIQGDTDLAEVVAAWPTLSPSIRHRILIRVRQR